MHPKKKAGLRQQDRLEAEACKALGYDRGGVKGQKGGGWGLGGESH